MPYDPTLGAPDRVLAYLMKFLSYSGNDILMWRLDDPDGDPGSWRLVLAPHDVSPASGIHYEDYVGKTVREAFAAALETDVPSMFLDVLRTGIPRAAPPVAYGDDKIPDRVYSMTVYPLGPDLIGAWSEDITTVEQIDRDRKTIMEQLSLKARELERSNRELTEFAYVASHDLRAPLRDIKNLASWISEDAASSLPPASLEHLERLHQRVERMQNLLDDLLEYSRAGRVTHVSEQIDISALMEEVRQLSVLPSGFELVCPDDVPAICTPKAPLEQVLLNLVGNAIKHHDRDTGRIEITWRDAGEFIEFAVADDGPGIQPSFHDRIFALFTTLRSRDAVEGSGMGLAIVKKLVEYHHGTITLESEGRGACFRFTWPKVWPAAGAPRP